MRWTPQELLCELAHPFQGQPPRMAPTLLRAGRDLIRGVSIDSRQISAGALFIPLIAARDGHDFLPAAAQAGAGAALVDREHEGCAAGLPEALTLIAVDDTQEALTRLACAQKDPSHPRICISGSNGKTTTRALLGSVLRCRYQRLQETSGNLNNHLGVPLTLLGGPEKPDARLLEFGMSALGENRHLSQIFGPSIAIITSIALEHLESMGSLENIAQAEAEPAHDLREGGLLLLPFGEPLLETCIAQVAEARALQLLRVGFSEQADIRVQVDAVDRRTRGQIQLPGRAPLSLSLPIIGAHNLLNAAYALGVGQHLGIDLEAMKNALENTASVGDRGKIVNWGPHRLIADCYNANPGSMHAALASLAHMKKGSPRIAVLGDMFELGPRSADLHRDVMDFAARQEIAHLFAIGSESCRALEALPPRPLELHGFDKANSQAVETLAEVLGTYPQGATVLFKASRGMRLEAMIQALQDR